MRSVVVNFITNGDHKSLMGVLSKAKCEVCDGTGERNDAEDGDIFHRSSFCKDCGGIGWNEQAVTEIVDAVPDFVFEETS